MLTLLVPPHIQLLFWFFWTSPHSANLASAVHLAEPLRKDGEEGRAKEGKTTGAGSHPVFAQEASDFLHTKSSHGKKAYLLNSKKEVFTK